MGKTFEHSSRHITNISESRPNGSRPNGGLLCAATAKNKFCFHLCIPHCLPSMTWQKSLRTKVNKQLIDVMTVSTYVYHGTSSMQKNVGKKMLCIICRTQFSLMDNSSFIKTLCICGI